VTAVFEQALLDTSIVIDYPVQSVAAQTASAAVSTITLAELAYGLHTSDPLVNAAREQRYVQASARLVGTRSLVDSTCSSQRWQSHCASR